MLVYGSDGVNVVGLGENDGSIRQGHAPLQKGIKMPGSIALPDKIVLSASVIPACREPRRGQQLYGNLSHSIAALIEIAIGIAIGIAIILPCHQDNGNLLSG